MTVMSTLKNLLAGLGGAVALNILHESLKKTSNDMPRIDLLGEEALQKSLNQFGAAIKDPDTLYAATLGGDLISNSVYYSLIGMGNPKNIWSKAVVLGLAAGIGAVTLPKPLELNPQPVAKNTQVKVLTVGYYLFGALVTAGIISMQEK